MKYTRLFSVSGLMALLFLVTACKKDDPSKGGAESKDDAYQKALCQMFGLAYHNNIGNDNTAPQKAEDILKYCSSDQPIDITSFEIVYGVSEVEVPNADKLVLVYPKDVPTKGGYVCFLDGSVKRVTAEEFKSLAKATPTASTKDRPVDISMPVGKYEQEFSQNPQATLQKYKGKVVELTGGVISGFSDSGPVPVIELWAGKGLYDIVRCQSGEDQPWAQYSTGQPVTIRGVGGDHHGAPPPFLVNCCVLNAGASSRIETTAEKLLGDIVAAGDNASALFASKPCLVTGVIQEIDMRKRHMVVKGKDTQSLLCIFLSLKEQPDGLQVGKTVKFYGEFNRSVNPKSPELIKCLLIQK